MNPAAPGKYQEWHQEHDADGATEQSMQVFEPEDAFEVIDLHVGINLLELRRCLVQLERLKPGLVSHALAIQHYLDVTCGPVYCTKIASRLARTFTDRHGLKDLCRDLLGTDISKQMQSSDWGAAELSEEQLRYAASDVLYLHRLRAALDEMLEREGRADLARACFEFLQTRAALDLAGWADVDIFAH